MFRFENLDIWKRSLDVTEKLFDLSDELDAKHKYRFAEQVRSAALSITNNIAEGSGSSSQREFKQFLNFSRRSTFESANMLIIASRKKYIDWQRGNELKDRLEEISKMIIGFSRSLQ